MREEKPKTMVMRLNILTYDIQENYTLENQMNSTRFTQVAFTMHAHQYFAERSKCLFSL